jgi:hypothetical protein
VLLNGRVPSAFFNERFYLSFEANDQFGNRLKSGGEIFSAKVLDGECLHVASACTFHVLVIVYSHVGQVQVNINR